MDQQLDEVSQLTRAADAIPTAQFVARAALVAVEIVLVIYLGQPGALFFYQMF